MFVKQLTEAELNEYERQLEGVKSSVAQLAANDDDTREKVVAVLDSVQELQVAIVRQIATFHDETPSVTPPVSD